MVLDKVYLLTVAGRGFNHHTPLEGFPPPPVSCRFARHAGKSSSEKVKTYPQLVEDFKQMRKSKSGLNVFEVLPLQEGCVGHDVAPFALSQMIQLGEYLAERYRLAFPALHHAGKDVMLASSMPEQDYFQSAMALLHGLLNEKQFVRVQVKKLESDVVRGAGGPSWCPSIQDIDIFAQKAYRDEHEVLNSRGMGFAARVNLSESVGVPEHQPTKEVLRTLSHWFCDASSIPCNHERCVNLTGGDASQMLQSVAAHNSYLSANEVFRAYSLADTYMHFETLLSWFGDGRASDQTIKVDVVDDFFFLKVLTALGHRTQDPILPSSRLVIEQYKKEKSTSSVKFWRVLVDGKVVTESLGVCAGAASKGFCGVDTIKVQLQKLAEANMFDVCNKSRDEL